MDTVSPTHRSGSGFLNFAGSAGLLAVMLVETIAVVGRHIGMPLLGALEIAQAAIVPAACFAMLIASLRGAHAAVHMVVERLPPAAQRGAERLGSLLAAVYFAALSAGSIWLADEYWHSFEQTEVLHIPFRPLRVLVALASICIAYVFLMRAIRPRPRS